MTVRKLILWPAVIVGGWTIALALFPATGLYRWHGSGEVTG